MFDETWYFTFDVNDKGDFILGYAPSREKGKKFIGEKGIIVKVGPRFRSTVQAWMLKVGVKEYRLNTIYSNCMQHLEGMIQES